MIVGQAAGTAAAQAVRTRTSLHNIDIPQLQKTLSEQKQILSIRQSLMHEVQTSQ